MPTLTGRVPSRLLVHASAAAGQLSQNWHLMLASDCKPSLGCCLTPTHVISPNTLGVLQCVSLSSKVQETCTYILGDVK